MNPEAVTDRGGGYFLPSGKAMYEGAKRRVRRGRPPGEARSAGGVELRSLRSRNSRPSRGRAPCLLRCPPDPARSASRIARRLGIRSPKSVNLSKPRSVHYSRPIDGRVGRGRGLLSATCFGSLARCSSPAWRRRARLEREPRAVSVLIVRRRALIPGRWGAPARCGGGRRAGPRKGGTPRSAERVPCADRRSCGGGESARTRVTGFVARARFRARRGRESGGTK